MNLKDLQYKYGLNETTINIIVWIHSLLIYLFDALLILVPKGRQPVRSCKLLVIKLDAIGDFVLWLDFARGLRELYPPGTHELTLLANQAWADFASGIPLFDSVMPVERMRFILNPVYRFLTLLKVRRQGFDILIDPTYSREFQFSPAVARTSGADVCIAPQGSDGNQRRWQKIVSDRWYNRRLPSTPDPLMELQRNAEFIRALGHTDFRARLPVYRPKSSKKTVVYEPYYVMFPGAGWVNRQWPVENFAELATRIHQATGWKGVLCGGPGEVGLSRQLREMTDAPLEDKIGQTTLDELAGLLASARLLVGNETSAVHLGAAVATRTACILGGGHFGRFMPYQVEEACNGRPVPIAVWHQMECFGCNWQCIYPITGSQPVPCIAGISVEQVWRVIRENLEE
jgi:ADP-heptose:LPS heptosyltransferase